MTSRLTKWPRGNAGRLDRRSHGSGPDRGAREGGQRDTDSANGGRVDLHPAAAGADTGPDHIERWHALNRRGIRLRQSRGSS